jgi:RHS repeat-associated protein
MFAPVRFWLALLSGSVAASLTRSRARAAALALTFVIASLVLPLPFADVDSADAAKVRPQAAREVVGLRSARTKTFREPDGSFKTKLSEQSLHYYDRSDKTWKDIDASFKTSAKAGTKWESGANRFSVDVASTLKDGFLSFTTDQGSLSLSLTGATSVPGIKAQDNTLTFKSAIQDVDFEYALLPDGLKETIVLRKPGAPSSYDFRLEPAAGDKFRAEEREDGSIWLFDESASEPAVVLLPPVVGDSTGQAISQPESAITAPASWSAAPSKAKMSIKKDEDAFLVTVTIEDKWLAAPERVYPVVLDPSWYSQPDTADGEYDTTAGGNPNVSATEIRTGRHGAGGTKYASALTFDLATLPPGAKVLDARLNAYLNACFPTTCGTGHTGDVELRRLNSPGWSPATPWASVSVNASLQDKVSFTTTPPTTWQTWSGASFTQSVQSIVNGSLANYGFLLEKNAGNDTVGYKWRSARWSDPSFAPYLDVYWIADGVQVNPSVHVRADGAELLWQHYAGGTSAYADAVFQDSPVGYWRLDEPAGDASVIDWSGNDVSASVLTPTGAVRAEPGALADLDLATKFLGSPAGYVKVLDDPVIRVNDTFTLETWVRRLDLTARDMAIFNDFGSGFWLRIRSDNKLELLGNGPGTSIAQSTTTIADTNWHHIAATKSGATVKLYIDGVDRTGTVTNQTLVSSTQGFDIGLTDGGIQPFYGWIDEATLYPSALTQTRIQAHYTAASTTMPGFQRFEIHRSAISGFTPSASTLIGTVADSTIQTYRDNTAKPSTTFYYKVVTVTAAGSYTSNELKADLPAQGLGQVTIQPGYFTGSAAATHISSATPTTEAGNSQALVVGSAPSNNTRTLIAFDMHVVPTGATVSSAQLQMYALQSTPALNMHRVTAGWFEGGATWNYREKFSSLLWATPGGDFDSSPISSSAGGNYQHWDSWALGSLLQQWINGTQAHNGLLVKYGTENGAQSTLNYAADGYARSIALRPKLVITYEDGSNAVSPTVAIAQPQASELVAGTVSVKAGALDDGSVSKVEFFLDGGSLGAPDTTAPFDVSWNTTSASRGAHNLTAKATDDAGNETTSQAVSVTVANSSAPTTSVTNATAGGAGVWTVDASASDDFAVSKVEFYIDGDRFASDGSSPYSVSLDTLAFPAYDGARTLTTRAYDADGNVTTSAAFPITVANTSGTKYKATISTSNIPLEQLYDAGAGTQDGAPLSVSLTNASTQNWPTASIKLRYRWFSADAPPVATDSANVSIGASDLGAGLQRNVSVTVDPPALPTGVYRARYNLRLDLFDTAATSYFAAKGNVPYETWVTVTRKVADELGLERYQQYSGDDLGAGFDHALNLANGNSVVQWVPFSQPGRGINSVVTMSYNSLEAGSVSPLGNNWSLSISSLTPFGLPLDVHPNAADTAAGRTAKWVGFTDADGSYHVFTGNAGGTYYTAPPGVHLYLKPAGGGFELWKPDRTKFVYGALGFPTSVEDSNGNALTYTTVTPSTGEDAYSLAKRVTTVTDAGARDFTLTYYSKAETPTPSMRGKLKRLTDHVGHALEFTYYEDGNLRSIREKGGPGGDGMPTLDRETFFTYTTPDGTGPAIATFGNRQNPNPATVQSQKLFSQIDFRGAETQFAYSTAVDAKKWRLTSRTNRTGDATTFSYDTVTRQTTATMPLSRVWTYTFDTEGRVTVIDDPVNTVNTQIEWADATAANEVTNTIRKVTAPSGEFVEYAYNANGYKTDEWDELRNHKTFEYDNIAIDANDVAGNWEAGRSISHLSQLSALVKPRGNATAGNPDDYRWELAYTGTGLLDTVTDPLGNVTDNAWNANGTLASQTLPANGDSITRTATYNTYDLNGLATQVTDAGGGVARAGYASNGNLLFEQDPNHGSYSGGTPSQYRTEYAYDAYGRLASTGSPKSTTYRPGLLVFESTGYDANDNETSSRAAAYGRGDGRSGALIQTTYDAMDRETLATGPRLAAQGGPVSTKTEYDAAGRAIKVTKPKGVNSVPSGSAWTKDFMTETGYDLLDREQAVTAYVVDGSGNVDNAATRITNYCYDDAGDLRSVTGPKGAASFTSCPNPAAAPYVYTTATHTTKFEYDIAHRQTKATDALARVTQTGYDENGQVNAETDEATNVTQTFYDDRGSRSKLVEPFDTGRTLTTQWEYDALGNLKRLISPRAFDAAGGTGLYTDYVESYSYDALSRLVTTTLPTAPSQYSALVKGQNAYAYWRLGEPSGTTMADSSGNGRNGSYVNSPTLGVTGALTDDSNTAMTVPSTAYTATASGISLANQSFSISFWAKRGSAGSNDAFVGQGTATTHNGLVVGFRSSNVFTFAFWGNDLDTAATYTDTNWHHWAVSYDASAKVRKIYRDGVEVATGTTTTNYQGSGTLTIGDHPSASGWAAQGSTVDEVGVWTRALAPAEVQQQYGTGSSGATPAAFRHQAYDPNGQTTWTSLPTTATTPGAVASSDKTQLSYWDTGQIYSSQDPANPKVRFDYTAEGWQAARIAELTGPGGTLDYVRAMYWEYLADGLLRARVDQLSQRALYSYDANGNRTQALEATGVVNPGQSVLQIDISYNSLDELEKVRTPKPGVSGTYLATLLTHDLHGNTAELTDNREENGSGSQTSAGRVFDYTYNAVDEAAAQTDDFASAGTTDDEQLMYTYRPTGELDTQTLQKRPSGSWVDEQSSVRTYFDNGLLKTLTNRNGAGAMVSSNTLSYLQGGVYLNGNRSSSVFQLKGPDSSAACYTQTCTQSWTYDARERVRSENPGTGLTMSLMLDVQGNATQETVGSLKTTRTFAGQQLVSEDFSSGQDTRYIYDSLGNVDCIVKLTYSGTTCPAAGSSDLLEDNVFDYSSRLTGYRYYGGAASASKTTDYTYDPLDRPVRQVETISGATTTYDLSYVGATNALSKEVLTGSGATTRRYSYDAFGIRATLTDGASRLSYLHDPSGSVALLMDQANAVKESYGYTGYGVASAALTRTAAGFNAKANAYRYTSKRLDFGSGAYDMGTRRYSSATGRFIQRDAFNIGILDAALSESSLTRNRYALAGANPINFVETDGHVAARIGIAPNLRSLIGRSIINIEQLTAIAKLLRTLRTNGSLGPYIGLTDSAYDATNVASERCFSEDSSVSYPSGGKNGWTVSVSILWCSRGQRLTEASNTVSRDDFNVAKKCTLWIFGCERYWWEITNVKRQTRGGEGKTFYAVDLDISAKRYTHVSVLDQQAVEEVASCASEASFRVDGGRDGIRKKFTPGCRGYTR